MRYYVATDIDPIAFTGRGAREAIAALNGMLKNELTAIDQYFLHALMLRHWGLHDFGRLDLQRIDRRNAARRLADRTHTLPRGPTKSSRSRKLNIGENPEEVLRSDLALEMIARNDTVFSITLFERELDYASRDIAT